MRITVLAMLLVAALGLSGCSGGGTDNDGLTKEQSSKGSRLKEIFQRTKGDWNALTADDKAFILSTTHGDERLAQKMWAIRGGAQIGPGGGNPNKGGPTK